MQSLTSLTNDRVKRLIKLITSKKHREETGLFVTDGVKLAMELVRSGMSIEELFVTQSAMDKYPDECSVLLNNSVNHYLISDRIEDKISLTESPQGVYCVAHRRSHDFTLQAICPNGRYLVLSRLQDAGNMGTMIRTCEAFAMDGLIVSDDCPDIYSMKVLRAAMGSSLRINIFISDNIMDVISQLQTVGIKVYATALGENTLEVGRERFTDGSAIVIGNEGNGLSQELIELCDAAVKIPMIGAAESLNASIAAGILLWEMNKR